jgi:DNA-binding MarR family transcriptional regulator
MAVQQNNLKGKFIRQDVLSGGSLREKIIGEKNGKPVEGKEIKWTKTQNIYKNVVTNIVLTTKWILDHCGKTLKQYEPSLTIEQFNLLRSLKMHDPNPSTINSLKENMLDKNSDVSRMVEKLRKKGWVERHDNERDRRVADVSLTKKGHALLSCLEVEERKWPEVLSGISEEEAEKLNDILRKLSKGVGIMPQVFITMFLALINIMFVVVDANNICHELI